MQPEINPNTDSLRAKDATELALLDGTPAKRLQLITGIAYFEIAPQPAGRPVVVNPDI